MFAILRRTFVLSAAAAAAMPMIRRAEAQSADATPIDFTTVLKYPFVVPPLPYAYDANEPSIDAQTMQLHHDKHHGAYVANLNSALKDQHEFHDTSLPDLLARLADLTETNRTTVRNNAGGHANHTMFWQIMGGKGGEPEGELAEVVTRDFGSFDKLKSDLNQAALRVFGSGWAMVLVDSSGKLSLVARQNQDSPLMDRARVLFGNDVWEHAYYLKYQNRRPDYVNAWWSVVNWPRISARYAAAKAGTLAI
jgi:superoxide dismutase, Fe-Mn family